MFYRPHERLYAPISGPSRTKQSFKDECDINNILKKFQKTGLLTHVAQYQGQYQDLPSDLDFQASINQVLAAQAAFSSLPSSIRARFENDPARFLEFVGNPANEKEMVEMGLAKPRPDAPAPDEPPANEPAAPNPLMAG